MAHDAEIAAIMDYIRKKSGVTKTDDFVNWVAVSLGLKATQTRKVYRWISGQSEPGMKSTLGMLVAAGMVKPIPTPAEAAGDVVQASAAKLEDPGAKRSGRRSPSSRAQSDA